MFYSKYTYTKGRENRARSSLQGKSATNCNCIAHSMLSCLHKCKFKDNLQNYDNTHAFSETKLIVKNTSKRSYTSKKEATDVSDSKGKKLVISDSL